tara:strand:- start:119 stop:235 length:117 start_codon:yes stop_codon:yes gene_type:complete
MRLNINISSTGLVCLENKNLLEDLKFNNHFKAKLKNYK